MKEIINTLATPELLVITPNNGIAAKYRKTNKGKKKKSLVNIQLSNDVSAKILL